MMLSDHGMPFPFAKTCVYHHSTHTPWMVRWPGTVKAGAVDSRHMISAIDFAPTILEIAGLPVPEAMQGRSFLPLLRGETQDGRDFVIKEYNENSGAWRHPMRSVQTRQYGYIFNPWSNGKRKFETATNGMLTAREMIRLAKTDAKAAERLRLFQLRVVEEFYDYANDPDALNNLIDDPAMQGEIDKLRGILETWMEETGDHCLEPFRRRGDPAFLNAYVEQKQAESDARRIMGQAHAKPAPKRDDLIALILPRSAMRGKSSFVTVHHTSPEELGKQKIHVTLKDAAGARIERKIQTVGGTGDAKFEFAIPDDANLKMVSFAAFIGEEFPVCLQHINSNNLPVN